MFDSVSIFRGPNKIFVTLNVFDFRIKTYITPEYTNTIVSASLMDLKGPSLLRTRRQINRFKIKRSRRLFYKFVKKELRIFHKLP